MTKRGEGGDVDDVTDQDVSQKKGNSKSSPMKGKGLVKGRRYSNKSSTHLESKLSSSSNLSLNPVLKQSNLLASLKTAFTEAKDLELTEEKRGLKVQVTHQPFSVGRLFNFLQATCMEDSKFCERLSEELLHLEYINKNNDLYQFQQTKALMVSADSKEHPYLNAVKAILRGEVKELLAEITGIELSDEIDLFAGKYGHTDYLLCHDDELEGRRIAFILYLVSPSWSLHDGGALDLFSTDLRGEPENVVKSLLPVNNSFAFFPVGANSFHQVAEVLSKDKLRLSLSGWFHGSPAPRPPRYPVRVPPTLPWIPSPTTSPEISPSTTMIAEWVSPMFFDANLAKTVRRKFGRKSEIQLEDFIRAEKMDAVFQELKCCDSLSWSLTGPANKSHYYTACPSVSPSSTPELSNLITVFRSEEIFFLLSHLTGLRLHPDVEEGEEEEEDDESESEGSEEEEEEEEEEEDNEDDDDDDDDDDLGGDRLETMKMTKKIGDDSVIDDNDEEPAVKKIRRDDTPSSRTPVQHPRGYSQHHQQQQQKQQQQQQPNCDSIHPIDATALTPRCSVEIRRWQHGCYSLLGDLSSKSSLPPPSSKTTTTTTKTTTMRNLSTTSELDVSLFVGVDESWDSIRHGGGGVYVAKDDEDELLSISPKHNALALVFRERDTAAFVKYVNSEAPGKFFQITCGYKETTTTIDGDRAVAGDASVGSGEGGGGGGDAFDGDGEEKSVEIMD